jgi:hypothetical protein
MSFANKSPAHKAMSCRMMGIVCVSTVSRWKRATHLDVVGGPGGVYGARTLCGGGSILELRTPTARLCLRRPSLVRRNELSPRSFVPPTLSLNKFQPRIRV